MRVYVDITHVKLSQIVDFDITLPFSCPHNVQASRKGLFWRVSDSKALLLILQSAIYFVSKNEPDPITPLVEISG